MHKKIFWFVFGALVLTSILSFMAFRSWVGSELTKSKENFVCEAKNISPQSLADNGTSKRGYIIQRYVMTGNRFRSSKWHVTGFLTSKYIQLWSEDDLEMTFVSICPNGID